MPTSGIPSRMAMVLAGDNTREGRVFRQLGSMSRQRMVLAEGDPFLGGVFRALGRGLGAVGRIGAASLGLTLPSSPRPGPDPGVAIPAYPDLRRRLEEERRRRAPGAGGIMGMPFPGGFPGPGGRPAAAGGRRRRRMNPLNPRALRRALSRAGAFARFAKRAMHVTFGKVPKVRFRLRRKKAT